MNGNYFKEKVLPHLLAVLVFTALTYAYLNPLLSGDRLLQHDYVQAMGQQHEITSYVAKTGHQTLWTNSMFGGMPSVQIWLDYPMNLLEHVTNFIESIFIHEADMLFLLMLGFYVMLYPLVKNPWLSAIGAIAFAFGSFNLISLEAGHLNKVLAITFVAPILGGLIVAYRGRWLTGGVIFAVFLACQLRANHVQITFYTLIASLFLGAYMLIETFIKQQLPVFAKATGMLVIAAALALATNAAQMWGTWEYSKATIRGSGSELSSKKDAASPNGGLDLDYAFSYSEGIDETMTMLIPNFRGGGQMQDYEGTESYDRIYPQYVKSLQGQGYSRKDAEKTAKQSLSTMYYWGGGGFSAGPVYFGAIICFLFVLGLFIVKSNIKWVILFISVLFILFSWGKNFSSLNYFLFSHMPMFNKFRTPSMNLAMVNVMFVLMAILALKEVLDGGISKDQLMKGLKLSAGITLGIIVVFGLLGGAFYSFTGGEDKQLSDMGILNDVLSDRKSLLMSDSFRSLVLVAIAAGLIWAYIEKKLKLNYFLAALGLVVLVDLWMVDQRCFNSGAFVSEAEFNKQFQPSPADSKILQDKDLSYRVLNLGVNPFIDAGTSYFHKSIGGYHAAKLRIYQELIENQLSTDISTLTTGLKANTLPPNIPTLNMLNTRYFMFGKSAEQVVRNPYALGNAWFVNNIKYVENADDEMAALKDLNPKETAVVRSTFKEQLNGFAPTPDSSAKITLTDYKPDEMTYEYQTSAPELAVFSEIYYLDGKDWHAYLDGKLMPHIRANYVLRAMQLPAGNHKLVFKFEPAFYSKGEIISLGGSSLILILVGVSLFLNIKKKDQQI